MVFVTCPALQYKLNSCGMLINTIPTFLCNWFCVKTTFHQTFPSPLQPHTCSRSTRGRPLFLCLFHSLHFPSQSAIQFSVWWVKVHRGALEETPPKPADTRAHTPTTATAHRQETHTHTLLFIHKFSSKNVAGMRTISPISLFILK